MVCRRGLTLIEVVIIVLVVGLAAGVVLPALAAERERARRRRCASNLKNAFGYCSHLYASDYKDSGEPFPPTVGHLYPDYRSDGKGFVCPSAAKATPVEYDPRFSRDDYTPAMLGDTHTDYVYVSGLRATDPAHYVHAFDDEWNHDGAGVNVLFIGSNVEWMRDIKAVHEKLARQEKELAAQGRKMKLLRPAWSRYPELPPPRRWYSKPGGRAVAVGSLAAVALALALVVRTVGRGRKPQGR